MAHGITENDGLALARSSAWHGLGTVVPNTMTPSEALQIAGLDWEVEESDVLTATFGADTGDPQRAVVETHKTLRRSDDQSILATVGADYSVLQNRTLSEIADAMNANGVQVETAGSLFGGKRIFFLLHSNTIDVGGRNDIVHRYVLLANSHDGTLACTAFPTHIRVVCNNTLTEAIGQSGRGAFKWKHSSKMAFRIDDIKAALSGIDYVNTMESKAIEALAQRKMSTAEIQSLWTDMLIMMDGPIASNPKDRSEERRREKALNQLAYMTEVFDAESQKFGATAWVAANAVTNLIEHRRGYLKGDDRINSNLFGSYGDSKVSVFNAALQLI